LRSKYFTIGGVPTINAGKPPRDAIKELEQLKPPRCQNNLPASDVSIILASLRKMHEQYRHNSNGKLANYIPEIANANPELFGIALTTADGQVYEVGDSRHLFTIQSISKPLVYGLALEDHGIGTVLSKVGVEPSGEAFNSIVFDERDNRPFNPMVNAGAIATTALVKGEGHDHRLARILDMFYRYVGRPVEIDHAVFHSEQATGHRNRAIAYLELNFGMIDEPIEEHLNLYFEQCSVLVSAHDLAVMAATLANNGINPLTGIRAIEEQYVGNVLSVMHSCGMYDYAGEWSYRVGLPAKSGVAGGIIAVLPGQFGIGTFSPLLDVRGNSLRGIQVCEEFSDRFKLHMFRVRSPLGTVVRRCYRGTELQSKRLRGRHEQSILSRKALEVCVYELQGDLFFGTMEQVFRRMVAEVESISYLILDLKRVMQIDQCAYSLLTEMRDRLTEKNKTVLISNLAQPLHAKLSADKNIQWPEKCFFADTDSALEWCENQLILKERVHGDGESPVLALAAMDILANFNENEIMLLQSILKQMLYSAGETIIHEGDQADSVFLLAAGLVSVRINLGNTARQKRLCTIAPGVAFGELALLDNAPRSADVVADQPVVCYVLPKTELDRLAARHPELRSKLIGNIARELSARLRRADAEIRALED
jgi:glutaminase